MDEALRARVEKRHQQLNETVTKATALLEGTEIQLADLTHIRIHLKRSIEALEKETFGFIKNSDSDGTLSSDCMEDQMKAEEILSRLDTYNELNSSTQKADNQVARLPKLDLQKYKGDPLKFNEFWDHFQANVDSRNLKDVDKLSYLLSSLQGTALDTVEGLAITNENYGIAVDMLKERFGSKEKVIDAHYKALMNIKKSGMDAISCRNTINSLERHLRVLHSLGEDSGGSHLRVLLAEKFPEQVMYQVHLLSPADQSIEKLRIGLEQVITAMERSSQENPTGFLAQASSAPSLPSTSTASLVGVSTPKAGKRKATSFPKKKSYQPAKRVRKNCIFCEGTHFSNECLKVVQLKERKEKLHGRCYLCFGRGHTAATCKIKKKCFFCKGGHNSALCPRHVKKNFPDPNVTATGEPAHPDSSVMSKVNTLNTSIKENSFLQTAVAKIQNNNKELPCRLIMDCGSQRSYLTTALANKLNIIPDRDDYLTMYTFASTSPKTIHSPSAEVNIKTKRGILREFRVNLVPHIANKIPIVNIDTKGKVDFLADDNLRMEDIDLLIGNDYYFSLIRNDRIEMDDMILIDTDFGWIVSGNSKHKEENTLSFVTYYCQGHDIDYTYFNEPDLPLRNIDMKFLWSLESIGITDSPKTTREEEAVKYFNETVKYNNGRYEVKWPWIQYPPDLPTNYGLAYGRLRSLLRRSDEDTLNEYHRILNEQMDANIIEEIDPKTVPIFQVNPPIHYIPHHMVKQVGKSGRIVYDASAKIKDCNSLNECMYRGPSLLEDLTALLLKFRTGKVAMTADVEKAFLQVGIQEEERDVTRFLWVKDPTKELTEDNIRHFRFCRIPFGIISSPFLLTASIRYHISKTNEALLTKIADKCYVDNLVTSVESLDEASRLYDEARTVFSELSMNIRDWVSNDSEFMQKIPRNQSGNVTGNIKILGLIWNLKDDTLQLKVEDKALEGQAKDELNKKDILRALARVYDPCVFASPLVLPAKLLFQDLCIQKFKWDSPLPKEIVQKWKSIVEKLKAAKDIKIPRYVAEDMPKGTKQYELHVFTDASKFAYSAVAYLRILCGGKIQTAFLMSKSRVTPAEDKDNLKIPRLELLGYLIGSRLLKYLKTNLNLTIHKQYLWTDSQVVLHWLKTNNLLPPFVKRRVDEINQLKDVEFCYINTNENPADLGTRPELWEEKKTLWFTGPPFLTKESKIWPCSRYLDQKTLLSVGEVLDIIDGPEMVMKGYEIDPPDYLTNEVQEVDTRSETNDTTDMQIEIGTTEILKELQKKHFPEEINGKQTALTRNLDLFLDVDGVLRCGGRMKNANWSYDKKHPILIPKSSEFTNRIIQETHEKNYHVGPPHTLNILREQYWIPQGKAQVTKVIRKCEKCLKQGGGPYKLPQTPALPPERVNYSPPFTFTGVDYFGPMYVSTTNGNREKRWVCLFTCLAVRAIHLELVKDLTAEECLLAVRRLVAARGTPTAIVSDNALQFKLTSELLVNSYCTENKIRWKFIPQLAPWHGGFYERLVGIVKHCLKRTLDKHLLNDRQLTTVIKEAEAVVNTRPLTNVGADLEHVLRPADFLTLGKCLEMTPSTVPIDINGSSTKRDLIQGWKRGQIILTEFKEMFQQQYLPSLREKHRGSIKQPRVTSKQTPQIGDVVQIRDESKNRSTWKVGKITSLIRGQDGEYRVAKVKVGNTEFTRSLGHLYPLEVETYAEDISGSGNLNLEIPMPVNPMNTNQVENNMSPPPIISQHSVDQHLSESTENPIRHLGSVNDPVNKEVLHRADKVVADHISECVFDLANKCVIDPINECVSDPVDECVIDLADKGVNNQITGDAPNLAGATDAANSSRPERQAAIRAREKIAEWTRNLVILLQ